MERHSENKHRPVRNAEPERTGCFYGRKVLVIGLTGGVATGKSTVAGMLAELGARMLSADSVVHELLAGDPCVRGQVVDTFGPEVLDAEGRIDRRRLGSIVFEDPSKRVLLERILHPVVLEHVARDIAQFRAKCEGILVVEIPLLVETRSFGMVDKVLVVTAEQETQIMRLEKRYGVSRAEALLRINSQLPMEEKIGYADWVVSTEDTLQGTKKQVEKVWEAAQKSLAQRR